MKLPAAWWHQLDFLAPDAREEFGQLIARLEEGLSTVSAPHTPDQPAGWSGLTNRGPWSRLLPSQWALADAAPDEFLRRATQAELAFWQLGQEAQSDKRSVLLWLDVGPDQLGACRVVQIAIMLWLQQVCLKSNGHFCWGTAQSQEKGYDQLQGEELHLFLKSRSSDPARRVPDEVRGVQTWCVGSSTWLSSLPQTFEQIELQQTSPSTVQLKHRERSIDLQMPPVEMAGRLLRNPFSWPVRGAPGKGSVESAQGGMGFSRDGRKFLLAADSAITVYPVPSSINEPPGRPRSYPLRFQGPILAASMEGRAIYVAQQDQDDWVLYHLNPGDTSLPEERIRSAGTVKSSMGGCWRRHGQWYLWLQDNYYHVEGGRARLVFPTRGGCQLGSASLFATSEAILDTSGHTRHRFEDPSIAPILLARGANLSLEGIEFIIAEETPEHNWWLSWRGNTTLIKPAGEAIAVTPDHRHDQAALLVKEDGRLYFQGETSKDPVEIDELVKECVTHPDGTLAYRTVSGQVGCYSLIDRMPRLLGEL